MGKFTAARVDSSAPMEPALRRFADALSQQGSDLENLLQRGLTFPENFNAEVKTLTITARTPSFSTGGGVGYPIPVAHKLRNVVGVWPWKCVLQSRVPPEIGGWPRVEWYPGTGQSIDIVAIWDLNPGRVYLLTVVLLGG